MNEQAYWEGHARRYDAFVRLLLRRPMPGMLRLATDGVRGSERVLEVAAGTGLVTVAIAKAASAVVATDYAQAMVDIVEERVREAGLANVTCQRADVYDLRFASGEFDAVVAANVLHLVPDLEAAIAGLRRVLRPGGRFIAPTYCHDETLVSRTISRGLAITRFPGHRRFTARSHRAALEKAGLRTARAETLPGLIPISYVEGSFDLA